MAISFELDRRTSYIVFFVLATMGVLSYFIGMRGIWGTTIAGLLLGWFIGWVQQWSIHNYFGRYIKGWRTISAIFTGITLLIVQSSLLWIQLNFTSFSEYGIFYLTSMSIAYMAIFGVMGIVQAILLRKHVRYSWVFLLSALIGGGIQGIPILGQPSLLQIVHYTITAFTLICLFRMSGALDNMSSEDEAIERLRDADYTDDTDYIDSEQHKKRDTLLERLFNKMGLAFSI